MGQSFTLLPTIDIINKASVFLPLLSRPEKLPKFSVVSRAADKESWVPLGIRGLFLKSSETFGPILGATIPFVSSQRLGSKPSKFAILLVFLTLKAF